MIRSEFAPAKVNLFLHVGAPGADGYHPLCSLVVFADVGDTVSLQPSETFEFVADGPFASGLDDLGPGDNLVVRALEALQELEDMSLSPARVILTKALPVAAGLGGGSSDAAAALRLARSAYDLDVSDEDLEAAAALLGSDGPMCLRANPVVAEGRGEVLSTAPDLPELHAVLVNPGVLSSTAAVYRAYDAAGPRASADRPALPDRFESVEELAAFLSTTRNDLEAPAAALQPAIDDVVETLRGEPEALFVRMSGSGATVFALCRSEIDAATLAERLSSERPDWWIRACSLGRGRQR